MSNAKSVKWNRNSMALLSTVSWKWLIEKQLIWHSVGSLPPNQKTPGRNTWNSLTVFMQTLKV